LYLSQTDFQSQTDLILVHLTVETYLTMLFLCIALSAPMLDSDRRHGIRLPVCFEVKVTHDAFGTLILQTANISDSGIYVLTEGQLMPNIGTILQVQLNGHLGENETPPLLDMIITRMDNRGIGLKYLQPHIS
jgi:hypothetical protein